MGKPTETPKHRGTIILDSNTLLDFRANVDARFTFDGSTKKRYFETLSVLGAQGVEILIPEEVVFETTRHIVSSDGKTLKDVRPYLTPPDDRYIGNPGLVHLCEQVLEDKIPGVHILSSLQLRECPATIKLRTVRKITNDHPTPDVVAKKAIAPHMAKLQNLSDKVIAKHIHRFAQDPDKYGIVYVLSSDRHFEERIENAHKNHNNIKILDTAGFMRGLTESGVIKLAGIKPNIPFQSIKIDIAEQRKRPDEEDPKVASRYVDTSCARGDSYHGYLNDRPFEAAMRELAQDLSAAHTQNVGHRDGIGEKYISDLEGRGKGVYVSPKSDTPMSF